MQSTDLHDVFEKKTRGGDGAFAIAYALMELAAAQAGSAAALRALGNGNASTHIGAIEGLSIQVGQVVSALNNIAGGISEVAAAT